MSRRGRHLALALLALTPACGHWDLGQRAPGNVTLETPPHPIAARQVEPTRDPGERWIALLPGPLVGIESVPVSSSLRTGMSLGAELTLRTGRRGRTHTEPLAPDWPERRAVVSLNLGVTHSSNPRPMVSATAFYAEAQLSQPYFGLAAGGRVRPGGGDSEFQLTGFFGPLFVRLNQPFWWHQKSDHALTWTLGLLVKAELAWFWSL